MIFREITFGSEEYKLEFSLREEILRKPLGLSLHDEDINKEKDQFHFGLFESNGNLIGCAVAVPYSSTKVKIRQMAVSQNHQKKGYGQKIMIELEKALQARGFQQFELNARATAVDFYKKLGYHVISEEFVEVTIPHYTMCKNI